jgi:hypothetical protein
MSSINLPLQIAHSQNSVMATDNGLKQTNIYLRAFAEQGFRGGLAGQLGSGSLIT